MSGTEEAVKLGGHKKFHRLQPHALIGTLRCGAGSRDTGAPARWMPVPNVLPSQQCRDCWRKAERA